VIRRSAPAADLKTLAQRILGPAEADRFFDRAARDQGLTGGTPVADAAFISQLERKFAGSIGAAMAQALISEAVTVETISLDDLMRIADETRRIAEHSQQLEQKSRQLEAAAAQLRDANARLRRLDQEKDDFLSQVSHEVRTPMTAIRSFSEILLQARDLESEQVQRYLQIIHDETVRLTRLLDATLDLGLLERGEVQWSHSRIDPEAALENSIRIGRGLGGERVPIVSGLRAQGVVVQANEDRLCQVFINVISNAVKFNTHAQPQVTIASAVNDGLYEVLIADNGPGIPPELRGQIFAGHLRGGQRPRSPASGAGLGLAISWQIMRHLGGDLELVSGAGPGACFRVTLAALPEAAPAAAPSAV
jgi:signal transduction histidine kinase